MQQRYELRKFPILSKYYNYFLNANVIYLDEINTLDENQLVELLKCRYTKVFDIVDILEEINDYIDDNLIEEIYTGEIEPYDTDIQRLLNIPIEELSFSVRIYNTLKQANINTVQLLYEKRNKLSKLLGLGLKSLEEINVKLKELFNDYPEMLNNDKVIKNDIINKKITDTDLSVRAKNALNNIGYYYVDDIFGFEQKDLLRYRNFGTLTIKEIEDYINNINYDNGIYNVAKVIKLLQVYQNKTLTFKYANYPLYKFVSLDYINVNNVSCEFATLVHRKRITSLENYNPNITFAKFLNDTIELADKSKINLRDLYNIFSFYKYYLYTNDIKIEIHLEEKEMTILKKRFEGMSRADIGLLYNQTSERMGQIEKGAINKIKAFVDENNLKIHFVDTEYTSINPTILSDHVYRLCFYVLDKILNVNKIISSNGNNYYRINKK